MLTFILLQPYSRVNTENPYPILDLFPDLLMLTGLRKVVVLPAVPIFKCHLPENFLRLNFSSNSLVLRKMIPYSRPNSLISIPFRAAHTYIAHIWEYPPPPGEGGSVHTRTLQTASSSNRGTKYMYNSN